MNIDVRKSIINNFESATIDEIKESITNSIETTDEITLPGLGVFFELLWTESDENSKEYILQTLENSIHNYNNL